MCAKTYQKHNLPGVERPTVYVLESVGDETAKYRSRSRSQIPQSDSLRLLVPLIPHTRNQNQTRSNSRLKHSQENPRRDKSTIIRASSSHGHNDTPEEHHGANISRRRQFLHSIRMREFKGQIGDVENQCQMTVFVLGHVRIFFETHDVGVIDECFVEVLETVAHPHQRHNHPVDFSDETLLVFDCHFTDWAFVAEEVEGGIDIGGAAAAAEFFDLADFCFVVAARGGRGCRLDYFLFVGRGRCHTG